MTEQIATKGRRRHETPKCLHHWIVETPHGVTSRGLCKRCGATKRFPNAAADLLAESRANAKGRWANNQRVSKPTEIALPEGMQDEKP